MAKKYIVTLSSEERERLLALIGTGTEKARTLAHARILLKADEDWQDGEISKALNISIATIERVRKRFVFEGLEASLKRRRSNRSTAANWMVNKKLVWWPWCVVRLRKDMHVGACVCWQIKLCN